MPAPKTEAEVFESAINIIETQGWARGTYQRGQDGPVCALGAIGLAVVNHGIKDYNKAQARMTLTQSTLRRRAEVRLQKVAQRLFPKTVGPHASVPSFNDYRHRTKKQVIRAMLAAAAEARAAAK